MKNGGSHDAFGFSAAGERSRAGTAAASVGASCGFGFVDFVFGGAAEGTRGRKEESGAGARPRDSRDGAALALAWGGVAGGSAITASGAAGRFRTSAAVASGAARFVAERASHVAANSAGARQSAPASKSQPLRRVPRSGRFVVSRSTTCAGGVRFASASTLTAAFTPLAAAGEKTRVFGSGAASRLNSGSNTCVIGSLFAW